MGLSILTNISALDSENELNQTSANLQTTLLQLSSGQRINSGADDPAGLSIANGLEANITALTQSEQNANDGVGQLQVADGALSQVTTLLNTAVTIATEAATGTVNSTQQNALNQEFQAITAEIDSIGSTTTFNGSSVFTSSMTTIFLSDGGVTSSIGVSVGTLSSSGLGLGSNDLLSASDAASALTNVDAAINTVAAQRGTIGASINRLQSADNVETTQVQNLTSAESNIMDANVAGAVSDMSKYNILEQTGMAALAQANSAQQNVLKLLQ